MQYGHFDNEKKEYVIDRVDLPVSWTNYLGIRKMCAVVNHTAGGYVFSGSPEYCVVLAVTGALKVFDLPWVMFPKGMPQGSTFLTGTYMYYHTMETQNVDYGSAIAVVIVVLGIVTSKVANKIFKEADY